MRAKKILTPVLSAFLGGILALLIYSQFISTNNKVYISEQANPVRYANLPASFTTDVFDFTLAAENTVHGVVHVMTQSVIENAYRNPLYEFFYGDNYSEKQPVLGFGSGVIISNDGYIVTNNHVIANSDKILVTLNDNRKYEAKLVGTDPSTDLAVLKIDEKDLPFIPYGDSENIKIGQWVLAVGNPYNLTSSVTAGIISAKGRNLGIVEDQYRIESFIQTDAALNKGNSGGALVNTNGELIGINTAIISPSGGYSGNSFAIPVSIVKKVVADIIEYGEVQRAVLGVIITDVDADIAKGLKLDNVSGVHVDDLRKGGAAADAGIVKEDVIVAINNVEIKNVAELQEQISKYRPNDQISVTVIRDSKRKQFNVTLRNMYGDTNLVDSSQGVLVLGAKLEEATSGERVKLKIKNGVKIIDLDNGKFKDAGIKEGFIILRINNEVVNKPADVKTLLENTQGGVYIEGIYPNGVVAYYAFGM
ncbi:MAG: trypsin-like peptidase domain-containing protein [Bacteroidales bacterium]|nr:trypsin-like peptidase domain-containing protein [Bacteroidales bacterium]